VVRHWCVLQKYVVYDHSETEILLSNLSLNKETIRSALEYAWLSLEAYLTEHKQQRCLEEIKKKKSDKQCTAPISRIMLSPTPSPTITFTHGST
jgi:hypothetical protein